jgi:tetratricopeptide (TPR) repeat protein
MNKKKLIKGVLVFLSLCLIAYGLGVRSRCILTTRAEENILMGRYHLALEGLEKEKTTRLNNLLMFLGREDSLLEYNIGVALTLLGENKEARVRFKKASETKDPLLRARALYNEANILAQDLDFVNAAQGYIKVLEIDPSDFQAKKNLERMRLGQEQFSTLFSPEREEREERVQALKLLPWGNRYKFGGSPKLRW